MAACGREGVALFVGSAENVLVERVGDAEICGNESIHQRANRLNRALLLCAEKQTKSADHGKSEIASNPARFLLVDQYVSVYFHRESKCVCLAWIQLSPK